MDEVYHETDQQDPLLGMRGKTPVAVPIDEEVDWVIFLVRSLDEDTGWRYYELPRSVVVERSNGIMLSSVQELQPLQARKDGETLLRLYEETERAYSKR